MNEITFTIGQNGYRIQIGESCAVSCAILGRQALVEQSSVPLPVLTVRERDHVWEATVHEIDGIRKFDELVVYLRRYAEDFDARYPAPLVLSRKAALRFEEREHKSPARLRPRLGDAFPGVSDHQDRAALFDERPESRRS
jgi:hypothetical protein